ncbi:MAG TPA: ribonuclease H-like domain-containing protein [Candidatus Paceibacterota bacterium]
MRKIVFDIETKNIFSDVGRADPTLLDISVVGVYDFSAHTYRAYLENELTELWPVIENADVLIGYNSDHFDIPLLNKYYPGDLTRIKSLDLLKEIKKVLGRRLRLDSVAEATLGVGKSGSGLDAIAWWKEGNVEKVKQYCLDDVRITKEIYDYARKYNMLKYKDLNAIREIRLDTSTWEEREEDPSALTHTLPF